MTAVYHYTTGVFICEILMSGEIELSFQDRWAADHLSMGFPAVWATTETDFARGAAKAVNCGTGYALEYGIELGSSYQGLFRVELKPQAVPLRWSEYGQLHLEKEPEQAQRWADHAAGVGRRHPEADECWRISLAPVKSGDWLGVDVYRCKRFPTWAGFLPMSDGRGKEPGWVRVRDWQDIIDQRVAVFNEVFSQDRRAAALPARVRRRNDAL